MANYDWDAFISHASEDKDSVARPLAYQLAELGLKVWLDEAEIHLGDSLRAKIDAGLARSRFGIVVLSPNFFAKIWTKSELDGLVAREIDGTKVILPIWHNLTHEQVRDQSPILSGRLAASTNQGLAQVATRIHNAIRAIQPSKTEPPDGFDIDLARAFVAAGQSPPVSWRPFIKTLKFDDEKYKFEDLGGLSELNNLEHLDLYDIDPPNLTPLANLTNLKWLYIQGKQPTNIAALGKLKSLEYLDLNCENVRNISALSKLKKLRHLNLDCNAIENVAPIANLKNLQLLSIGRSAINDITPLQALNQLRTLDLWATNIENIDAISNLHSLQNLSLWGTQVSDLSALSCLEELRTLDIDRTKVTTISPILGLSQLRHLNIFETSIHDTALLASLPDLEVTTSGEEYSRKTKIDLSEPWQTWYWPRQLGISIELLEALIAKHGHSANRIHRVVRDR